MNSPRRDQYAVLLREFDWANEPTDDPHYWVVSDVQLNGRSLFEDFKKMSGMPHNFNWDVWAGVLQWSRTREGALSIGEEMIAYHRNHFFIEA